MRVSELLSEGVEKFLSMTPETEAHLANCENPHGVTKAQVGLSNVSNEKQATDTAFRSHKTAHPMDHPDGSVTTEKLASQSITAEKLSKGAVGGDALREECITNSHLAMAVRNSIAQKVDKAEGMGLSENSFTDAEKAKLALLEVKDGEGVTVDTENLMLKSEPLILRETGERFALSGKDKIRDGVFASIISIHTDVADGKTEIAGRGQDDVYKVLVRDYDGKEKVYTGTANTVCHARYQSQMYFGEMSGNTITVLRDNGSGGTPWQTLTTSRSGSTELWQMFVEYDDIRVVYLCHAGSPASLVAERFDFEGVRKWSFSTYTADKSGYGENSTIYKRAYKMACMEGKDLFLAPVLDTNRAHAVLRISETGEVTGKYKPITNFISETGVLQDISVYDGVIYGFASGAVLRIDTVTGKENVLLYSGRTGLKLRGLSVGLDGNVYLLMDAPQGIAELYKIDGRGAGNCRSLFNPYVLAKEEIAEVGRLCRCTERGIEIFGAETGGIFRTRYEVQKTYAVV